MTDLFKCKAEMPSGAAERADVVDMILPASRQEFPVGCSVATAMTIEEQRNVMRSNYPRFGALDVEHVRRPRFGKGM